MLLLQQRQDVTYFQETLYCSKETERDRWENVDRFLFMLKPSYMNFIVRLNNLLMCGLPNS